MPIPSLRSAAALLSVALAAGCARPTPIRRPPPTAELIAMQRAWWTAFVLADTATLGRLSASPFSLTLSSGRTFDRAGMLAEAASYTTGSRLALTWGDESVRPLGSRGDAALVTGRMRETEGRSSAHYRYATVAERQGGSDAWRVAAAQSTRELEAAPRIAASVAGDLAPFAGRYRIPNGAALVVAVQDSALAITDPNGAVLRLEAVGPALFESTRLSASNGLVRFSFARDAAGRVTSLSRLLPSGVNTFPRVDAP